MLNIRLNAQLSNPKANGCMHVCVCVLLYL